MGGGTLQELSKGPQSFPNCPHSRTLAWQSGDGGEELVNCGQNASLPEHHQQRGDPHSGAPQPSSAEVGIKQEQVWCLVTLEENPSPHQGSHAFTV